MTVLDLDLVRGSKGGGKGKGGSSGSNADNTLRSKARARWVEIVSEGPCVGLVGEDGVALIKAKYGLATFFEQTPVLNQNGSENFKNVIIDQRFGLPDQEHFTGFSTVETPFQVETQVKFNTGPVTRTIAEKNADAVRVIVRLPSLVAQDKKSGKLKTASVSYAIEVKASNGDWQVAHTENLKNQKTVSAVQRAHRIDLPLGGFPWDLRVVRLSADSEEDTLQNETWFESYTVLVEGKFTYPSTAMVAMEVNAEDMGQSIPARSYRWRGLIVNVPANYDPETRTYTGGWNGEFKKAWTNNPAWIFYDLLTNDRYGLGEFVSAQIVDKWSLYAIAQHCDVMVKTGLKNADGTDKMEPRYTYNGVLKSRDDAWRVLQQMSTAWRGMAYWSLGQVFATADMPEDPVKLFSKANVAGGFNYSGTAMKARHSVCHVSFNDPDDFYRPSTEPVINDDSLVEFGWKEKSVSLNGCTSRTLAHRYGKWILDVEANETETVDFTASWDSTDIRPGNLIAIADPRKGQVRFGGRLKAAEHDQLWLDGPFVPLAGSDYSIYLTLPTGEVQLVKVSGFANEVFGEDGESLGYDRVLLQDELTDLPLVDSMWILRGTDVNPRLFRVLTIKEDKKHLFKITALFHDPAKYARVEDMQTFRPPSYTRPSNESLPPENLRADEVSWLENGQPKSTLTLSWTNPRDFMTKEYEVAMLSETSGYKVLGTTQNNSMDIEELPIGSYTFFVTAISYSTVRSQPAQIDYEVAGWQISAKPTVSNLTIEGSNDNHHFAGKSVTISWLNNFAESTSATADGAEVANVRSPFYDYNTVKVYDTISDKLLRTQRVEGTTFTYTLDMNIADNALVGNATPTRSLRFDVTVTDTLARESLTSSIRAENPVPAAFNPDAVVSFGNIHLSWPAQTDDDFAGVLIWVSKDPNFDPLTTDPVFDGPGGSYIFPGEEVTTYHIRAAGYDAFGKTGLLISPVITVSTTRLTDDEPPATPTGLELETVMQVGPDGTLRAVVRATLVANTEDDLAVYQFQIKEGDGPFITAASPEPVYEWVVTPGLTYTVQVRALDRYNNASDFCEAKTIIAARDTVAPGTVKNVSAVGLFRSIWVDFDLLPDPDMAFYEVEATKGGLTTIYTCAAPAFIHSNLTVGDEWTFRVRGVDTSGNRGEFDEIASAFVGALTSNDLPPDAIVSSFALIDQAFIESGHIVELDAGKLQAGSVIAGSVKVATSAGNLPVNDAAGIVNANSTLIEPGRIRISGSKTFADWRYAGDETLIDGGEIATNTISAEKLLIGMRGISTDGLQFEHNSPATNSVSWTAGSVRYVGDDGNVATRAIAAGNAAWTSGYLYLIWVKGANQITTTTSAATAFAANAVVLAVYAGGKDLTTNYGRTVIDGSSIKTGSVTANSFAAGAITADVFEAGSITGDKLAVDSILAKNLKVNSVTTDKITLGGVTTDRLEPSAVTAAVSARTAEAISVGAITTIQSAGITTVDGSFVQISGSFVIAASLKSNSSNASFPNNTITVAVYRDGDLVESIVCMVPLCGAQWVYNVNAGSFVRGIYMGGIIPVLFKDDNPGAGTSTYALRVTAANAISVNSRNLFIQCIKR